MVVTRRGVISINRSRQSLKEDPHRKSIIPTSQSRKPANQSEENKIGMSKESLCGAFDHSTISTLPLQEDQIPTQPKGFTAVNDSFQEPLQLPSSRLKENGSANFVSHTNSIHDIQNQANTIPYFIFTASYTQKTLSYIRSSFYVKKNLAHADGHINATVPTALKSVAFHKQQTFFNPLPRSSMTPTPESLQCK